MMKTTYLLIGSFMILQVHGASENLEGVSCKAKENYTDCAGHCEPICNYGEREVTKCTTDCAPGCVCDSNRYIRDIDTGECIKKPECRKCKEPNEVFACRNLCDEKLCRYSKLPNPKLCKSKPKRCVPMCYCRKGYARNKSYNCIPVTKCPNNPKCGENEVYDCHKTCQPKTCKSMVEKIICPPGPICTVKCDCKDNYLRNEDGICIPSTECVLSAADDAPPAETDNNDFTPENKENI